MTIVYTGNGVALTNTGQVLHTVPGSGVKSSQSLHVQVSNIDTAYQRTLEFWLQITGGRNLVVAEAIGVDYGTAVQFTGLVLNPGESLQGYAETNGLLIVNVSVGEQR